MRFVGKQVHSFRRRWYSRPTIGPILHISDMPLLIALVDKISYLGIIVRYRAWEIEFIYRRVQVAQTSFRILCRWVTDRYHPLILYLRLYHQCILATVFCGIFEMGITSKGVEQTISIINQHHRIMTKTSVHIIRENTTVVFDRFQINPPWFVLQKNFPDWLIIWAASKSNSCPKPWIRPLTMW